MARRKFVGGQTETPVRGQVQPGLENRHSGEAGNPDVAEPCAQLYTSAATYSVQTDGDTPFEITATFGRVFGAALTLGNFDAWAAAATYMRARLSAGERAACAWAAMRSLDPEYRAAVAETVGVAFVSDAPEPPFDLESVASDAGTWATAASPETLTAYALAAFRAMEPADQRGFAAHISCRIAA